MFGHIPNPLLAACPGLLAPTAGNVRVWHRVFFRRAREGVPLLSPLPTATNSTKSSSPGGQNQPGLRGRRTIPNVKYHTNWGVLDLRLMWYVFICACPSSILYLLWLTLGRWLMLTLARWLTLGRWLMLTLARWLTLGRWLMLTLARWLTLGRLGLSV